MSQQVPRPLDPELAAYLDWPLYIQDDSVSCDKGGCTCGQDGEIPQHRRMTVRELLADIKNHLD
jgi:hypothetical protein